MTKKEKNNSLLDQEEKELDQKEVVLDQDLVNSEQKEADEENLSEKELLVKLNQEVEQLKDELAIERTKFLKAHADLENTKKRLTNDYANRSKYMIQDFALSLLPTIDNLEKVLSDKSNEDNPILEAVEMIYRQLKSSLQAEGVEEIEALNKKFDPNFHHAVIVEKKADVESDIVIEELQKGYKLKDRVLRATMVKVSQ